MLKKAGYKELAAFGKWHLGHSNHKYHPISQGFTSFYGHYNGAIDYYSHLRDGELDWHKDYKTSYDVGYSTDLIGSEVVNFISKTDKRIPFFAYVAFNAPHSPMQAKLEELQKYGYDPNANEEKYEEECRHTSEMENLAANAERDSIKYMQVKYMIDHQDKDFLGVISGVTEWGIYIEIIENKCEGMVRIQDLRDDHYIFDKEEFAVIGKKNKQHLPIRR